MAIMFAIPRSPVGPIGAVVEGTLKDSSDEAADYRHGGSGRSNVMLTAVSYPASPRRATRNRMPALRLAAL